MKKHLKLNGSDKKEPVNPENISCLTEEDIIAYLFHDIPAEERFRIENHFTECDLCYDAVTGARKLKSENELRVYTAQLRRELKKKYFRFAPAMRRSKLIYYSAAALVLIALGGMGYWMNRHPNRLLADEYIKPYSNAIPLSRSQNKPTLLEDAMAEYESENYAKAIEKLNQFIKENPDHLTAHLYFGISALISGETKKALPSLQKASGSSEPWIAEAAQWYTALADLKLGNTDEARIILIGLSKQNGYFTDPAGSLLEQIKIE